MAPKTLPDLDYVRQALAYDPDMGEFRWRIRPLAHFRSARGQRQWNPKYAGMIAGSVQHGYVKINISGCMVYAHRLAWLLAYGEPVPPMLDHIDGNPLNNRIANLRAASVADNHANMARRTDNTTGVKGVYRHSNGRFRAQINYNGTHHHLGYFATLDAAAEARREAANRLQGMFARHD